MTLTSDECIGYLKLTHGLLINGHADHNADFVSNNRVHDIDKGLQTE